MKWKLGILAIVLTIAAFCIFSAQLIAAEKNEKGEKAGAVIEQEIAVKDLPSTVRSTMQYEAKKGKIDSAEKSTEGMKVVYSADITRDGLQYDCEVTPDGKLISMAREVAGEKESGENSKARVKESDEENEGSEGSEANEASEANEKD